MRDCSVCKKEIFEGFLVEETSEIYCDECCSKSDYSSKEWLDAIENGRIFWTTWIDEED